MNEPQLVALRITEIGAKKGHLVTLSLNRPEAANAFNGALLDQLCQAFQDIAADADCRLLVIQGRGRNFCAGADLGWMQSFTKLSLEENRAEARRMSAMFEALYRLPMPTIAVVRGAAFGGAVGLVAACDMVIASDDAKFSLSEVRVGLLPAVILPYVARKLGAGQLRRNMLSGRVIPAAEAAQFGLVEKLCKSSELNDVVRDEINEWLKGSPDAQRRCKSLLQELADESLRQSDKTADVIASARVSNSALEGIRDFFNKQNPAWVAQLSSDWTYSDA